MDSSKLVSMRSCWTYFSSNLSYPKMDELNPNLCASGINDPIKCSANTSPLLNSSPLVPPFFTSPVSPSSTMLWFPSVEQLTKMADHSILTRQFQDLAALLTIMPTSEAIRSLADLNTWKYQSVRAPPPTDNNDCSILSKWTTKEPKNEKNVSTDTHCYGQSSDVFTIERLLENDKKKVEKCSPSPSLQTRTDFQIPSTSKSNSTLVDQPLHSSGTVDYTIDALQSSDGRCRRKTYSNGNTTIRSESTRNERHTCNECGKSYATSSNLSRHKQTHRPLDSPHAKKCPYCDRIYVSMPAMSMHLLTHKAAHKCTICNKSFSRPWLLQGHMRAHTGHRPYGCAHCGKAFADRSNLRAHMHTHTGIKKHRCSECGKMFALKSYLNKHIESVCPAKRKCQLRSNAMNSPQYNNDSFE